MSALEEYLPIEGELLPVLFGEGDVVKEARNGTLSLGEAMFPLSRR